MISKKQISLLLLGICASCCAQKPFTCHVKLDKPLQGKVVIATLKDKFTGIDTIDIAGDEFTITQAIERADEYRILSRPYRFDITILAQPGCQYEALVKGHDYEVTTLNGDEQNRYSELKAACAPLMEEANKVGQKYMKLKEAGKLTEAEQALKANNAIFEKDNQAKFDFIKKYPNTLAGMKAADEYLASNYKEMKAVRDLLKDSPYKYTFFWRSIEKKYQEMADKWIEGKTAPDFTTTDIHGKTVHLSDFRGKTVLLDFWASWCVPCRAKMKELRKIYDELKKRNIVVVSISLDEKRTGWEKATQEDGIIWTNTCDLKPFRDNAIGKAYKVTSVPQLYVINPEGNIVAQNPTIEEILKY